MRKKHFVKKRQEKRQKKREKRKVGKKGKEGPKGYQYHPRWAPKLIFYMRTVNRNRNEIDAQKKTDFEHPTKKKKMKKKENERK